jgi:hypothetical protein
MTNIEIPEIDIAFISTDEITAWKLQIALRFFGKEAKVNLFRDINTGYTVEVEQYCEEWSEEDKAEFANWLLDQANLKRLDEEVSYTELRAPGTIESEYKGAVRSNYFAVRELESFEQELKDMCREDFGGISFKIIHSESFGVPTCAVLFYSREYVPIDEKQDRLSEFFKRHLQDEWVAVILQTGAMGFEYLHAAGHAFNNKGDVESLDLNDMGVHAKRLGANITEPRF